jgi:hypothetical protein
MARMPMGPYSPYKTSINIAKKYYGKNYDEQAAMIDGDRAFIKEGLKPENLGGRTPAFIPDPISDKQRAANKAKTKAVMAARKKIMAANAKKGGK